MDTVAHLNVALAGRYEVEREIGAGGMATVYLARDLRHKRKVALKVLRPDLGAVLGVERFLSEIQVTANLQHPNLLPLFDSGETDGRLFYVMPFVEGESLGARLERERQLPIDEALRITTAVAAALEYAHSQGVIHRDLKPENILLQAGQPVIADFGIALAVSNAGGARITQTGLSLGTPQYMSPEQATGDRRIDRRTDIYSLGAIAYEMLAGEPPHAGATVQATIARMLTEKPRSIRSTRSNVPEHVDAAVLRALDKLPADRFASAQEFADALTGKTAFTPSARRPGRRWTPLVRDWRLWAGVAAAGVASAVFASVRASRSSEAPRVVRMNADLGFDIVDVQPGPLDISRDGRRIVYVGRPTGDTAARPRLYLRALDQLTPTEIPGTLGAQNPVLSPDGAWVVFRVGTRLLKAPIGGGSVVTVVEKAGPPVEWNDAGMIRLNGQSEISEVDARGGTPAVIYRAPGYDVRSAVALPGTTQTLFVGCPHAGWCTAEEQEFFAIARGSSTPQRVAGFEGADRARYVNGYLVYLSTDKRLRAVRFDPKRLTALGQPVVIDDDVSFFAVSARGDLVLVRQPPVEAEFLIAEPGRAPRPLGGPRRFYFGPEVSPDGRRIAVEEEGEGAGRLAVFDIASATLRRLTSTGHIGGKDWTPDGSKLVYGIYRGGVMGLEWMAVDGDLTSHTIGEGASIVGLGGSGFLQPKWVPDGHRVVYEQDVGTGRHDIMMTDIEGHDPPTRLVATPANETSPRVSPDGRWLAYLSDETGRGEAYVQRFPGGGSRIIVSTDGAGWMHWSRTSSELLYDAPDRWVYAAQLGLGSTPRVIGRDRVLDLHGYMGWAPFPVGRRFLLVRRTTTMRQASVTLVLDWSRELAGR